MPRGMGMSGNMMQQNQAFGGRNQAMPQRPAMAAQPQRPAMPAAPPPRPAGLPPAAAPQMQQLRAAQQARAAQFGGAKPPAPMAGGVFGMTRPAQAPGPFGAQIKAPMMTGQAPALARAQQAAALRARMP